MYQLSLFGESPKRVAPRKRKPAVQQMAMFANGDLFGGGVAKADCPSDRVYDLVLAHPDETEEEAREREARERTINGGLL